MDLGKTFCSLVGLDEAGAVVLRRTIRRSGLMKTIEKLGPKVIAMEACCGAHFVGRRCQALGIEARLVRMPVPISVADVSRTTGREGPSVNRTAAGRAGAGYAVVAMP